MTFVARFESECFECFCSIHPGDEVTWYQGNVVHEECAEEEEED